METLEKVFFESATAKIYYDSSLDTLFLKYKNKVVSHDQFVKINSEVLEAFKSLSTRKFVAEIHKMGIISLESQQWVANILLPGMIAHLNGDQLYHAQYLDQKDIFVKVAADGIKKRSEEKIVLEQFADWNQLTERLKDIE